MGLVIPPSGQFLRGVLSRTHNCFCQGGVSVEHLQSQLSSTSGLRRTIGGRFKSRWISSSSLFLVSGSSVSRTSSVITSVFSRKSSSSSFDQNDQSSSGGKRAATRPDIDITRKEQKQLTKIKAEKVTSTVFYDSLRIFVKGGTGGQGFPKHGGVGGKGGDIVAIGHKDVSLKKVMSLNPSKRFMAETGVDSKFFCLNGLPGKNIIVPVPVGVSVLTELGHKIGEINKHGEKLIIAKGGAGGSPSNGFSAEKGQSHNVILDLKLIADVGFVGFPNAGKSTLLKALSRASPKIASYPFTTVRPNIGVMEYPDYRVISLADLPGLIEGAHANVGMGHKFLKHVERTKVLLFIVDLHGFQLSPNFPHRSALETIVLLNKELELYKEELTEKPAVLALNKSDLPGSYQIIKEIKDTLSDQHSYEKFLRSVPSEIVPENVLMFEKIIPISAKCDPISVNQLKQIIRQTIDITESESALAIL